MTDRVLSAQGLQYIERWEGQPGTGAPVLTAYLDSGANPTLGYGHTLSVKLGDVCTPEQAQAWLRQDVQIAADAVDVAVKVLLSDAQFAALVSFTFNVGVGSFLASTLLKMLNLGNYAAVPGQLMRWNRVNGQVNSGLVNRRAAEAGLWARGSFVASASVAPAPAPSIPRRLGVVIGGAAAAVAGSAQPALDAINTYRPTLDALSLQWIKTGLALICAILGALAIVQHVRASRAQP